MAGHRTLQSPGDSGTARLPNSHPQGPPPAGIGWFREPPLLLWFLVLASAPIYSFNSGLPQIADILGALLIAVVWLHPNVIRRPFLWPAWRILAWFIFYTMVVNCAWAIILADYAAAWDAKGLRLMLLTPLFYLFNGLLFVTCIILYQRYGTRLFAASVQGLTASIIVLALSAVFLYDSSSLRQTLTFNNPNQLGYHALLAASGIMLFASPMAMGGLYIVVVLALATFLVLLSGSKAAAVGIAMLVLIFGGRRPVRTAAAALFFIGILIAMPTRFRPGEIDLLDNFRDRVVATQDRLDASWAGRGYDRILNHPQYLIVGAGEGVQSRIDSVIPYELHSTLGTVLFSYGTVGLLLFLWFLVSVFRSGGAGAAIYTLPAFLYGATHQGLRASLFWVLLASVVVVGIASRGDRRKVC